MKKGERRILNHRYPEIAEVLRAGVAERKKVRIERIKSFTGVNKKRLREHAAKQTKGV